MQLADVGAVFAGQTRTELGVGNQLLPADDKVRDNTRTVQRRNLVAMDPAAPLESWELFDSPANTARLCPHFSVEMETGTGKTYVYLRTILELSRRYGFQKFIIVVPSVAIREGVLKNLEITADHFRSLYDNIPFEHFVYDAKRVNRLRQFATSNTLQILVINIDAFRKNFTGTEEEQVVYDSQIEKEFARRLDEREDIKLFVKLPRWFEVDTPVGRYNPDWAILKHDGQALYLVRETKGTRDFLKLRTSEADKVRCGLRHFEALGVPFAVAVSADEV
jgi:restriction endonuclease